MNNCGVAPSGSKNTTATAVVASSFDTLPQEAPNCKLVTLNTLTVLFVKVVTVPLTWHPLVLLAVMLPLLLMVIVSGVVSKRVPVHTPAIVVSDAGLL